MRPHLYWFYEKGKDVWKRIKHLQHILKKTCFYISSGQAGQAVTFDFHLEGKVHNLLSHAAFAAVGIQITYIMFRSKVAALSFIAQTFATLPILSA